MLPEQHVWIFNSSCKGFPGGVFAQRVAAEQWIAAHGLTGVLTAYPLDEGCFDFAVRCGFFRGPALERHKNDANFIGSFSSASLDHYHYEDGKCVSE